MMIMASPNTYDKGDLVRLTATFTVSSAVTDPTTITLKVQDPSGNEATYTYALAQVTKVSTGVYRYDLTIDEAGYWTWRWAGTGTVVAASESYLLVRGSEF
jgi:hypothetical protein